MSIEFRGLLPSEFGKQPVEEAWRRLWGRTITCSDNEAKEDLLGFQYLCDGIVSIVKNDSLLPATLGVFGDWEAANQR
jgi:hypothetical protein